MAPANQPQAALQDIVSGVGYRCQSNRLYCDACYQKIKQIQAADLSARFSYLGKNLQPFDDVAGPVYGTMAIAKMGGIKLIILSFLARLDGKKKIKKS